MEQNKIERIMDECDLLFNTLSDSQLTTWNFFASINEIVSNYKDIDCLMHFNFVNGNIMQGICIITDWEPGALVFQSDDGEIPKMKLIFPEEYVSFMEQMEPIINVQYPKCPKHQE